MYQRIKPRRSTAEEWLEANPVLEDGEIGIDLTVGNFKVGDGETAWTDLDYLITASAQPDSAQDLATHLQDIPAEVVSHVMNAANWNPNNRYTGPTIPNGLTMKVYYSYPADPSQPAYKYEFWPGNKVVRLKVTN